MNISKNEIITKVRKAGLPLVGDFIILLRSEDIISGIAIDSSPFFTYMWTFILPSYDDLSFLHMTLGERVSRCIDDIDCLTLALDEYNDKISRIKSAQDIIEYIDTNSLNSEYAKWTKLISIIRRADSLKSLLTENLSFESRVICEKYNKLMDTYEAGGSEMVQRLLDEWSIRTSTLLIDVPYNM